MLPKKITTKREARQFVHHIIFNEGVNFHPDTPFKDYIEYTTGETSYTKGEAALRQRLLDQALELPYEDIYKIAVDEFFRFHREYRGGLAHL